MLSQTKDPSQQSEIVELREQLVDAKAQINQLNLIVTDLHESVSILSKKVREIAAVNEIILSVQQNMLEELAFGTQVQQKNVVPIFSFPGNDDDDLPN
jgi:hypothetical protein